MLERVVLRAKCDKSWSISIPCVRLDVFLYIREYSNLPNRDLIGCVCKELSLIISSVWAKASIPCVSDRSIQRQIETVYKSYQKLKKDYMPKKESQSKPYKDKAGMFLSKSNSLFDICRCPDYKTCSCPNERKLSSP